MPRIGVKEEVKTRKKVSSADEKKEKVKKVVGTEKGKANQKSKAKDTKKVVKKKAEIKKEDTKKTKKESASKKETPKTKSVTKKLVTKKEEPKKTVAKKTTTKKTASPTKKTTKKEDTKKTKKESASKKETPKTKSVTKKLVTKKEEPKKTVAKKTTTKKTASSTKKTTKKEVKTTKKSILKTKENTKIKKEDVKTFLPEYYDLPYRYNDTIVKILYQTPKRIFVYWDISDDDRRRYINAFGEDFFERTYPVLLVHNEELNYTFEVLINDFANSWYIDINDSKSKYVVQFGRKFKEVQKEQINYEAVQEEKINLQNDFIYIADSNKLETPNDHILFEKVPEKIVYKNVKTGAKVEKEVKQVLRKIAVTYDNEPHIEEMYRGLYKELYGEEILNEEYDISNPSSGGSSSFFK